MGDDRLPQKFSDLGRICEIDWRIVGNPILCRGGCGEDDVFTFGKGNRSGAQWRAEGKGHARKKKGEAVDGLHTLGELSSTEDIRVQVRMRI